MAKEQVGAGQTLTPFVPLQFVQPGTTREADFLLDKGSRSPVRFHLSTDRGSFPIELRPPLGELVGPKSLSAEAFAKLRVRLGGMHESTGVLKPRPEGESPAQLAALLTRCVHAALVGGLEEMPLRFSAAGLSDGQAWLLVLQPEPKGLKVSVHADDAIGGNLLLDEVRAALED